MSASAGDAPPSSMSVTELLDHRVAEAPDAVCLLGDDGTTITYAQYAGLVDSMAASLEAEGVGPGTVVSWQLPTSVDAFVLVCALARLGAVQNPILPIYRERELTFIVGQCRPDFFVTRTHWRGVDFADLVKDVLVATGSHARRCVLDDGAVRSDGPFGDQPAPPRSLRPDVRWLFYSSGTTADPKGALHTDTSMCVGAWAMVNNYGITAEDRYPLVFPFTHVGGIQMLVVQLLSGCSALVLDRFDEATTPGLMKRFGATLLCGGTPLAVLFLDMQRHATERLLPDLRAVFCGASPKAPWLHAALRDEMGGTGALSCYGLTEAPMSVLSRLSDSDDQRATTEGCAIPGSEVRAVAEDGSICAPGVEGELRVKGPQVCLGYLDTHLNAQAFDAAGFFRTGDLGTVDAEGYVRVSGRLKDIIIRRGENISSAEVEGVLATLPGVRDAAVVGLPDDLLGERCCAVVEPSPGAEPPSFDQVVQWCRDAGLARQKTPEQLEVVGALPRNASGKVLKHVLRRWIVEGTLAKEAGLPAGGGAP